MTFKSGFVAILGRPNVGKSTFLNHVMGQKIAIMSDKAQTTRNKIMGIYTTDKEQIVFIDLAVPRDMEPGLSEIEGVELYTIDDFKLSGPSAATMQSMEQAEAIIQEEIDDFYVWYQGRALIPRIQEIKEDAVTDLNLRLHKILGKLPLSEQERKDLEASIDTAAGKVVTKMIFGLRDTLETDAFIDCVEGLEKVYEE